MMNSTALLYYLGADRISQGQKPLKHCTVGDDI